MEFIHTIILKIMLKGYVIVIEDTRFIKQIISLHPTHLLEYIKIVVALVVKMVEEIQYMQKVLNI